jgi:hypothetical protein
MPVPMTQALRAAVAETVARSLFNNFPLIRVSIRKSPTEAGLLFSPTRGGS